MTTWVPIFDDSFSRIPVKNYPAVYAAGYRVMAGYVAGGSASKWVTAAEIRAWLACGPDAGFLPLFEAVGDEPVASPSSGTSHARAARLGARARGVADSAAISPAMDRDVTMAQAHGPINQYMRLWKNADTMPPLPYIEMDAGGYLYAEKLTAGTGTPAAYGWDPTGKLVTPANAPAHVLWTQEHNGVALHGGSVDIGHIRTTAPIMWAKPSTEDDMLITDKLPINPALFGGATESTVGQLIVDAAQYALQGRNNTAAILALLSDPTKLKPVLAVAMASLPAGAAITQAMLQGALVGALQEFAAPTPAGAVS